MTGSMAAMSPPGGAAALPWPANGATAGLPPPSQPRAVCAARCRSRAHVRRSARPASCAAGVGVRQLLAKRLALIGSATRSRLSESTGRRRKGHASAETQRGAWVLGWVLSSSTVTRMQDSAGAGGGRISPASHQTSAWPAGPGPRWRSARCRSWRGAAGAVQKASYVAGMMHQAEPLLVPKPAAPRWGHSTEGSSGCWWTCTCCARHRAAWGQPRCRLGTHRLVPSGRRITRVDTTPAWGPKCWPSIPSSTSGLQHTAMQERKGVCCPTRVHGGGDVPAARHSNCSVRSV